jgi:hypothetical protein
MVAAAANEVTRRLAPEPVELPRTGTGDAVGIAIAAKVSSCCVGSVDVPRVVTRGSSGERSSTSCDTAEDCCD